VNSQNARAGLAPGLSLNSAVSGARGCDRLRVRGGTRPCSLSRQNNSGPSPVPDNRLAMRHRLDIRDPERLEGEAD
jgi:hypothetical protein